MTCAATGFLVPWISTCRLKTQVTDDTRIQRIVPTLRDIPAKPARPLAAILAAPIRQPRARSNPTVVLPALEPRWGRKVVLAEIT